MGKKGGGEYEVGYGKPPRASQWAKGTSGNYAGRPKKKSPIAPSYSFNTYLESFFKEMSRPVRLPEGDQPVLLTAFQAVLRTVVLQALEGDLRAAKFLVERMDAAVDRREKDKLMMLKHAEQYKIEWTVKAAAAQASGIPVPFPHADHFNFSMERGVFEITGPIDHEGAVWWEQYKALQRLLEESVKDAEARVKEDPSSEDAKTHLRHLRRMFKRGEAAVPPGWDWREKVDLKPFLKGFVMRSGRRRRSWPKKKPSCHD